MGRRCESACFRKTQFCIRNLFDDQSNSILPPDRSRDNIETTTSFRQHLVILSVILTRHYEFPFYLTHTNETVPRPLCPARRDAVRKRFVSFENRTERGLSEYGYFSVPRDAETESARTKKQSKRERETDSREERSQGAGDDFKESGRAEACSRLASRDLRPLRGHGMTTGPAKRADRGARYPPSERESFARIRRRFDHPCHLV